MTAPIPPVQQPFDLVALYKDLHQHPELGFAEHRTAAIAAEHLRVLGFEVITGIATTGVVGVLRNGEGPTVLLRADMDALPVLEQSGLDYASTDHGIDADGQEVPVMHACGHDVHVTCLIGAAEQLAATRDEWQGTVIALFQPAEEGGGGANAMVQDGLYDRIPHPDVVFGQHVASYPAGTLGARPAGSMAGADLLEVEMFGRGGHGSEPETTVDPVVMAASTVMKLQTVVSREISPLQPAVVTVGKLQVGTRANIIAESASLGITIRSFDEGVRAKLLNSVQRIINAEAESAGAPRPPHIEFGESYPVTYNDPAVLTMLEEAFAAEFGEDVYFDPGLIAGSEDVGVLAQAANVPLVYWNLGGYPADAYWEAHAKGTVHAEVPSNHSPFFAPVIDPTLARGAAALVVATRTWLAQHS